MLRYTLRITSPKERAQMMETLLRGIEEYAPGMPTVVTGDMNTLAFDLNPLTFKSPDVFRPLLKEDPDRFLNPIPHEPLFAVASKYGYEWQASNVLAKSTQRYYSSPLSSRVKLAEIWLALYARIAAVCTCRN